MVVKNEFCVVIIKNPKLKTHYAKNDFFIFFEIIKKWFNCLSMYFMVVCQFVSTQSAWEMTFFIKK